MAIDEQSKQHEPLLIASTSYLLVTSAPNRPELSGNVDIGHNTAKQHDRLNNAATESKHDDEKSETATTAAQRLPKLRQQEEEKQAPQSESQSE